VNQSETILFTLSELIYFGPGPLYYYF